MSSVGRAVSSLSDSIGWRRAFAQKVESHVAAGFGPCVVLLGQDRADQAVEGGAVGEDADHVGATPDLLVQPLLRIVRPDLPPDLRGNAVNASRSCWAVSKWAAALGNLASKASRTCRIWAWTASVSGC